MQLLVKPGLCELSRRGIVLLLVLVATEMAISAEAPVGKPAEKTVSNNSNLPALLEWDFEAELMGGTANGALHVMPTGPTSRLFEGQPEANRALELQRRGAFLRIPDAHEQGPLDFHLGDSLTLESWVRVDSLADGTYAYLLGKGRTYEGGVKENHNYALRLAGAGALAKLSFLFSTQKEDGSLQYHRWTSTEGFALDGHWHHVALSYTFGSPSSIAGYVDGNTSKGKWDMGGETTLAPTVDNDAVWIGSSRGGAESNSLLGAVDDVRIHRQLLPASEIKSRRILIQQIPLWPETAGEHAVTVTLHAGANSHTAFPLSSGQETMRVTLPKLAIHRLPVKMLSGGVRDVWKGPVLMRAFARVALPAGRVELLMRSPGRARLWVDGQIVLETAARRLYPDAHQPFVVYEPDMPWLRVPHVNDHESRVWIDSQAGAHEVVLESLVGGASSRCELGETLVASRQGDAMFTLLGPSADVYTSRDSVHLVDSEFEAYRDQLEAQFALLDRHLLEEASSAEDQFWQHRHHLARQSMQHSWPAIALPKDTAPEAMVDRLLIRDDAPRAQSPISDLDFLRRASLDTVGVPPTPQEIDLYLSEPASSRRSSALERLIADDRWADHWTSYWQDVLAENPSILKPSLNNSGPFRFWIHDSLLLNKPMDRFVTELIRMEGSNYAGGPEGFGIASENDVPMAEKAHIVASAFLAVDMKCARCHDAPYHPWKQHDLFSIGAMLQRKEIQVPESSSVPTAFFDRREDSPIEITLHPGDVVLPEWPADQFSDDAFGSGAVAPELLGRPDSPRERLAARITRGENRRFAETIANRVWTKLMGWGLVSSTEDWYESVQRNPQLISLLARDFVLSGYDLKQLAHRIMSSQAYQQRAIDPTQAEHLVYAAPWQRRLSAEQVVDSMHAVTGTTMETEPITFDLEASQKIENFLNLGVANRAWKLTSLSNERDRPSLNLPKAAAVVECLEAFGWRASRQSPLTHREEEANLVQPGVVANGHVATWVTRLTDESRFTEVAIGAQSVRSLVEDLFMAILTRPPSAAEAATFVAQLEPGFEQRLVADRQSQRLPPKSRGFATWSNHFAVESNALMREIEREVAAGPMPTQRLSDPWREQAEDAIWALINAPEFQLVP